MERKPTEHLLNILKATNNIDTYLSENSNTLIDCNLCECLNDIIIAKGLVKANVIRRAELNEIYGFQIFSGKRTPSRNKLLCLCIGMALNLDETQQLLKTAGFAPLYPKSKRDSIILFGISNHQSICDINENLYSRNETVLC